MSHVEAEGYCFTGQLETGTYTAAGAEDGCSSVGGHLAVFFDDATFDSILEMLYVRFVLAQRPIHARNTRFP